MFANASRRSNDVDPVAASKRSEHPIVQVIPPIADPVTGQKKEARSGNAHLIPLMQEARLLAPPGLIKLEAGVDCELVVCWVFTVTSLRSKYMASLTVPIDFSAVASDHTGTYCPMWGYFCALTIMSFITRCAAIKTSDHDMSVVLLQL